MNTSSPPRTYEASNSFEDVDDPHGYIARLLTPAVLARYEANGVPPNELNLKVRTLQPALPCPALPCPFPDIPSTLRRTRLLHIHTGGRHLPRHQVFG